MNKGVGISYSDHFANARPVVVAGHACIDLIPELPAQLAMTPGTLTHIGPMKLAAGGAVPNVSMALSKLGVPIRLAGQVGDDLLGRTLEEVVNQHVPASDQKFIVRRGEDTSYSVVVAVPGQDRSFWHCPGVNDTFDPDEVGDDLLRDAGWLHFGYPPIMRKVCDNPNALRRLFDRAQQAKLMTSLDLCSIDPASHAGRVDWRGWLARVLPGVDIFMPSFDEVGFALDGKMPPLSSNSVRRLAKDCLSLGATAVLLKLGDAGLYYRDAAIERHVACFDISLVNATGAGDCTIAGFIAAQVAGRTIEEALNWATGAGACSCEQPDATTGVPSASELIRRIEAGWQRRSAAWS